jgi:rhodanese-related sulfurtransferase
MTRIASYALFCILFLSSGAWADAGLLHADDAYRRARSGNITLIDIRSPAEWRQTGVPRGAMAITMHNPDGIDAFYRAILAATGNDKQKPLALICAAGNRSRWAQKFLTDRGFTRVENVGEGLYGNGVHPGWLRRGLPLDR